jgi:hypothetical protein
MPFSSVLGASSAIKPGVVTSSTRPSVPYVGQMIFETDTNKLGIWNGSEWRFFVDVDTPPALELVKTQTVGTSVTSVTVTNAFSATYDRYLVTLAGGTTTTNRALNLTLGATATGYYSSMMYITYSSSTITGAPNNGGSSFPDVGVVTTDSMTGRFEINSPFLSMRTDISWLHGGTGSASQATYVGAGFLNNNTSYTDFTLTMAGSGAMTGGTIRVYGYRNS